jgi:hypothetical protein
VIVNPSSTLIGLLENHKKSGKENREPFEILKNIEATLPPRGKVA